MLTPLASRPATVHLDSPRLLRNTDTGGIVYYANYLKFFERARTEWLRAAGLEQQRLLDEFACSRRRATSSATIASARLDDLVEIDLRIARAARVSIVFEQAARRSTRSWRRQGEGPCVDARRLVPMAMPTRCSTPFVPCPIQRPAMTPVTDLSILSLMTKATWSCSS